MEYTVTNKPTEHDIRISGDDIKQAVMEWLDRNTDMTIPDDTRLWLTEHERDHGSSEIVGRLSWTSDDVKDSA